MTAKILIVDDEPHLEIVICQLFRKRIKTGELKFLFALQGEEALRTLEEHHDIDVVFTDINMPVMNGLTLLKRLEQDFPLIRSVVITAYGDMKNIRTAMNHGAFDFLNKPINFNDLKITLDKTLKQVDQIKVLHLERQRRFLAETVNNMHRRLHITLELDKVIAGFLETLVATFDCQTAALGRCDDKGVWSVAAQSGPKPLDENNVQMLVDRMPSESGGTDIMNDASGRIALLAADFHETEQPGRIYLLRDKPFEDKDIDMVSNLAQEAQLAVANARLFENVRFLSVTDGLTNLNNHRHFLEIAEKEVIRSRRYSNPLTLIMLDIDHFKEVNDTHGHPVGDEVLAGLAEAIRETCRQTDISGRFGGDEMMILLLETDLTLAEEIAERLRVKVAGLRFTGKNDEKFGITISQGLTQFQPYTDNLAELIRRTDELMMQAKQKGRDQSVAG